MKLIIPDVNPEEYSNPKLRKKIQQFLKLLNAINQKEITKEVEVELNGIISEIYFNQSEDKELTKVLSKAKSKILSILEKKLKIVSKNHYRNQWMVLGMSIFGVSLGTAFGVALGNMGLLGIGLPIGMAIGLAIGTGMDKKTLDQGLQLDFENSF